MRPRGLVWAGLLVALLGASGASAADPAPKRRIVLTTEYDDRRHGAEAARAAIAHYGLVDDPDLAAYVQSVGARLSRHAPRGRFEYQFRIVDQSSPNAFALPGGYVFVSRGLLQLVNSEDELACVLGHEITHIANRHAAARQMMAGGGLRQLLIYQRMPGYSRDQEHTADRQGQGLAALAGFDPRGMVSFLRNLELVERLQFGHPRLPSFWDTHPGTLERVANAALRASNIEWKRRPGIAKDRAAYLELIDGLAVGTSAAEGVFRGDRFIHPDLGFTLRLPRGWETQNTHTAVAAASPDRRASILLESSGEGEDPVEAARRFVEESKGQVRVRETKTVQIAGRAAHRLIGQLRTRGGGARIHATFIPHRGSVLRITGFTADGPGNRYEGIFVSVARSFRPLPPDLAASVLETRLRIAEARGGETLGALGQRTGNTWSLLETSALNAIRPREILVAGQLVKIAASESYVSSAVPAN